VSSSNFSAADGMAACGTVAAASDADEVIE